MGSIVMCAYLYVEVVYVTYESKMKTWERMMMGETHQGYNQQLSRAS